MSTRETPSSGNHCAVLRVEHSRIRYCRKGDLFLALWPTTFNRRKCDGTMGDDSTLPFARDELGTRPDSSGDPSAGGHEPEDADAPAEADLDAFEDHSARESALQDEDDADPLAPLKPAFPSVDADPEPDTPQAAERTRQERGNRGPDDEPGFGQGA